MPLASKAPELLNLPEVVRRLGWSSSLRERILSKLLLGCMCSPLASLRCHVAELKIDCKSAFQDADTELDIAVDRLRCAANTDEIPRGLLARSCLRSLTGAYTGPASGQSDLDEAWEIAERGPMKLFLADIHLNRARLFFREKEYPREWISPQADLTAAQKLINDCGYHRRDEELADAKKTILSQ